VWPALIGASKIRPRAAYWGRRVVNQVIIDLLTGEEKAAFEDDVEAIITDTAVATTVTYHEMGSESFDPETGAVTETSGVSVSDIKAYRAQPNRKEMEQEKIEHATDVFYIAASDLSTVTPKLNDYITVSSVNKYIRHIKKPSVGAFYKFFTGDKANA